VTFQYITQEEEEEEEEEKSLTVGGGVRKKDNLNCDRSDVLSYQQ